MHQASIQADAASITHKRFRWLPWALGLLVVLALVAVTQAYLRHRPAVEDPLKGDAEAATSGLTAVLQKTPPDQRISLLRRYLQDANPGLRYAAVDALGETKNPAVAADVEGAFNDSASIVRQRALEALPKLDKERGLRLLLTGLRDEDKWIQDAAINQINAGVINHPPFVDRRAVPFLIQALDSSNEVVSTMAMSPLRKLTGQTWKVRKGMSTAQRQQITGQWKAWWKRAQAHYPIAPELASLATIRPERTDPAPDFHLTDINGQNISLQSQWGKVTLLNFWGTWCPPCQLEIPDLVQLDQIYRNRGLDVVGIALSEAEGAAGLRRWCKAHGVAYRQALSTEGVQEAFGHIEEVPVSVLIDRQGRIRYRWEGERDLATFRSAVELLLQEPSS